jgi:uncharacterized protein involved in cysteine biosynthesis
LESTGSEKNSIGKATLAGRTWPGTLLGSGLESGFIMQIARGLVAPFRGAFFVSRHNLWGFVVIPLLLNLAVAIAAGWWGGDRLGTWVMSRFEPGWLSSAVTGLLTVVVAVLALVLFQPVFSAPFIDLLCERSEKIYRGNAPSAGLLRSVAQAISHGILKMAFYGFALAITLIAGSLTGAGGFLGAVLYAVFVAYDAFDYPLARRAVSFGGKWRYLLSRPGQTVGYCCGAGLFYFVPLAGLLAPSFAAVGATLLFLDEDRDGAQNGEQLEDRRLDAAPRRGKTGHERKGAMTTEKGEMTR